MSTRAVRGRALRTSARSVLLLWGSIAFLLITVGCSNAEDKDNGAANAAGSAPISGGGGMGGVPGAVLPGTAGGAGMPASSAGSGSAAGSGASAAHDAGAPPSSSDDDGGTTPAADGGSDDLPRTMQPIDAPVADDCIEDVTAGDHTFSCGGLTFLVLVDPMCTQFACGLIFDIHGATMSGAQMRDNTLLYKIAPSKGYLVVNPSATASNTGGTWDLTANPPTVADFMDRMIKAFHVDPDRVHVTGFSQGSAMTFWFLQNRHELLASAAPVSGATDVAWMDDSWTPRVPILYENGQKDQASTIDRAVAMVENIHNQLKLTGGMEIAGDGHYSRKHWTDGAGMDFDYIEHDYGGQAVLDGHCIPGGIDVPGTGTNNFSLNATTCTTGDIKINWGELVLQWFLEHPRKR
jgi:predicted esterase